MLSDIIEKHACQRTSVISAKLFSSLGVLTLQLKCHDGNSFINGIGLTEANSLIHLLDNDDTDDDNELNLINHSAYYGENEFSKMLSNKAGNIYFVMFIENQEKLLMK